VRILDAGLVPIIAPEIDVHRDDKEHSEELLRKGIVDRLAHIPDGSQVMLKLSIPTRADFYTDLIVHPKLLRLVACPADTRRRRPSPCSPATTV
jgi:fructose-bisphosphate aldolase class I